MSDAEQTPAEIPSAESPTSPSSESSPSPPPAEAQPSPAQDAPADPAPAAEPSLPAWVGEYAALGETPIPGDDPAGESMVRETLFESIEAEIKKPQALSPEPTDWRAVDRLGKDLLGAHSKDVKVGAYMAVGLATTQGARGLAMGAVLLDRLARTFGASLHPRRFRARDSLLTWAGERLTAIADGLEAKKTDVESLTLAAKASESAFRSLKEAFNENGKEPDGIVPMRRWSEAVEQQRAEAEKAARAGAAPAKPRVETTATPSTGEGIAIDSVDDAKRAIPKVRKLLQKAAGLMGAGAPTDPAPYRLARFSLWPDKLVFEVQGTATPIPLMMDESSAQSKLGALTALAGPEGLAAIEAEFLRQPWWLDLQRVLEQKMAGMGPEYEAARGAVVAETLGLSLRFPGILDYAFREGVPFASPATRSWLAGFGGGEGSGGRGSSEEDDDQVAEVAAAARAAAAKNDLRGAIEVYQRALASQGAPRSRFALRLGLARTCLDTGHASLALPHLEELRAELQTLRLVEWAPDVASEVLSATVLALRAEGKKAGSSEMASRAREALAELSRLDPLAALELDR